MTTGTIDAIQDDDIGVFAGMIAITGTVAVTQDADTSVFTGTSVAPSFTGAVPLIQADDTGVFTGEVSPVTGRTSSSDLIVLFQATRSFTGLVATGWGMSIAFTWTRKERNVIPHIVNGRPGTSGVRTYTRSVNRVNR